MAMTIDWTIIPDYFDVFMKGLETTLIISIISIVLGFVGGILIGMCRISRNPLVYGASTVYVEAFRGTPLLIQIFLVYLGLPQIGIYIDSPLVAGLIALSLNSAAYQSEIFRGGVQSISIGQIEAARSLGMTYNQALFSVVIPQAIRNAMPPYTNEFITMIKDSSLVMTIGVLELTLRGKLISATTGQSIPVLLFVAVLYFVLTFSTSRIMRYVERRFAIPGMMGSDSK
ncbi:MAG: glutamine ABC transporter permease protein [Methanomassiliicoccales archaeon PtaB.Bin134]|nr:MAG: glutamine ABC transporter permease protein [Methanomassiliicoccales archaeon PtaB.Bin134]